jgi:hypothetical protein
MRIVSNQGDHTVEAEVLGTSDLKARVATVATALGITAEGVVSTSWVPAP